jgi:hypothetical protein
VLLLQPETPPLILRKLLGVVVVVEVVEDGDVEGDCEGEDLDARHLPQVAALLLVVHGDHHG